MKKAIALALCLSGCGEQIAADVVDIPFCTNDYSFVSQLTDSFSWWEAVGARFRLTEDVSEAKFIVKVDKCPADGIYGKAFFPPFEIILFPSCMDNPKPIHFNEVLGHEFGHILGIWEHVPFERGRALMNPFLGKLGKITEIDIQAFSEIDYGLSILPTVRCTKIDNSFLCQQKGTP